MGRFSERLLCKIVCGVLFSTLSICLMTSSTSPVFAQELKDELDALEDTPPADDLVENPKPTAKAPPAGDDPLDDLPVADAPAATADVPAAEPDPLDALGSNEGAGNLDNELQALEKPSEALTGVELPPAGKIVGLDFRQLPDRVRLTVKTDRAVDWSRELRSKRRQVILELKNMNISKTVLRRALDTGEFDGPVALVQAFEAKAGPLANVKVLFQLRSFVDPTITRAGNDVIVDFPLPNDTTIGRSRAESGPSLPETFLSLAEKVPATGSKISLNAKAADLQDVLALISKASGKNFVIASGLTSKVTLTVKNAPWDEVLRIILVSSKLGYQKIGNIYRVASLTDLRAEIDDAVKSEKSKADLTPTETRLFALSYAKATDVNANLGDFKSSRGKSSIDARTNTVVVTDIPEVLEKVARYVKQVDRQTALVQVEARIVEAKKDILRNLNLNWNATLTSGRLSGSLLNVGATDATINSRAQLNIGRLGSWATVQAILGAQETEKNVKTIASPRVTVLDNKNAVMSQGDAFPVTTPATANTPATTTYQDAVLKLEVTPQVTSDGYVLMKIKLKRDLPPSSANATVSTRSSETEILVESGKTAVIGGVYTSDSNVDETGIPWLRSIPVLGSLLFRANQTKRDISNELMMFISPKILNPEKAFLVNAERSEKSEGLVSGAAEASRDETLPSQGVEDDFF
jgi:type IV pilus assembly protein PilQ